MNQQKTSQEIDHRGVVSIFIKNTAYQAFNQIFLRLIAAVSGVVIIRFLSKEDYGLLTLVMAIAGLTNWLSNLGLPTMIIKSISQFYTRDKAKAAAYYRFNLKLYGGVTLLFALGLFLLAAPISKAYNLPQTATLIRLAVPLFVLLSLLSFYEWIFGGLNEFKSFSLKVCLPKEILTVVVVILFLYLGLGVAGIILAQILGVAVALVVAVKVISSRLRGGVADIDKKWILRGAMETAPANLAYASTVYMDVIIIGALLTTPLLASYRVCLAAVTIALGFFPIGSFIMPTFNLLDRGRATVLLNDILKFTIIVSCPMMFFIASFSKEIIAVLFGAKYVDSSFLLSIFAFVLLGQFVAGIFVGAISYLERFKAMSKIWVAMALVNVCLLFVLIKLVGLAGAVVAVIILYYTLSLLMGYDINRHGMKIELKPLMKTIFIAGPLLINFVGMNWPSAVSRGLLFVGTMMIYLVLLKIIKIFIWF